MYVNLELSEREEFVTYGTMIKILVIIKSRWAKGYYLIQKLEPFIGRMYLPQCFGYKFLPQFDLLKI